MSVVGLVRADIVTSHLQPERGQRPQLHAHRRDEADDVAPEVGDHAERAGGGAEDQQHLGVAPPDADDDRDRRRAAIGIVPMWMRMPFSSIGTSIAATALCAW